MTLTFNLPHVGGVVQALGGADADTTGGLACAEDAA